jgi:hypothetical protein
MPTLASNRKGFLVGSSAGTYEAALSQTTSATVFDQATGNQGNCIQYFKNTGRGGGTFRFVRTFLHFDTSGISGASSISLQLTSVAGDASDGNFNVVAIKHSAGSSNGSAIVSGDFDNIDRSTNYSTSTAFGSSGTITFSLNATAATQINGENDFNVALVLTLDQQQAEEDPLESSGDISCGIAFSSAINLVYTAAATGYSNTINTVSTENIGKVDTVATANIEKIIGI